MEKIQFKDLPNMTTPLSSANLNQMQDNMEDAIIPIKLVNIGVTTPATATTGDMFYNTTDNKIYTATADNTWDNGSTPRYDGFYINTNDNTLFYYNGSTLIGVGGSGSSATNDSLPIGMIMPSASQGSITDWLLCDGSAVSRTEYSELYNTIGTTYGSGDGSTTFNLPNIKGKMIIGYDPDDTDFDTMGATGGSKTHTQTVEELATHNHIINSSTGAGNPIIVYADGQPAPGPGNTNYTLKYNGVTNDSTPYMRTKNNGNGQPMDIMNPYIVLNYYIKAHKTAPIYATVKNEETTSETDVYSCNYINNMQVNITTNGTPVKTGRIIDGKEEWVKRINFGTLPNNSSKDVNTGLNANNITVTEIKGLGVRSTDNHKVILPYISSAGTNIELSGPVISNNQYVRVATTTDRTNITAKIEIYFTYNS